MGAHEKITAILVAGNTEGTNDLDFFERAAGLFSDNATVIGISDKPVEGVLDLSPITTAAFTKNTANFINNHGKGGILFFSQFGHGGIGPAFITGDGSLKGKALVDLISGSISDPKEPPHIIITMDGCFSGGFGKLFLEAPSFKPDFFFGASPPYSINPIGSNGIYSKTCDMADHNNDGVVTIRERAVCQMNNDSPLAVMYNTHDSIDVDTKGNQAIEPYFPKEVENIETHKELMKAIESLRFGEQIVVLVEGQNGISEGDKKWFENEAAGSGGFYRFISVKYNSESSEFFSMNGETSAFVVGPNLRYRGVKLAKGISVAERVPLALASENPLLVLGSWQHKIPQKAGRVWNLPAEYIKNIKDNPTFSIDRIIEDISKHLHGTDEEEMVKGLDLLKAIIQSDSSYSKQVDTVVSDFAATLLAKGEKKPSRELLLIMEEVFVLLGNDATKGYLARIEALEYDLYGKYIDRTPHGSIDAGNLIKLFKREKDIGIKAALLKELASMVGSSVEARSLYEEVEQLLSGGPRSSEFEKIARDYLAEVKACMDDEHKRVRQTMNNRMLNLLVGGAARDDRGFWTGGAYLGFGVNPQIPAWIGDGRLFAIGLQPEIAALVQHRDGWVTLLFNAPLTFQWYEGLGGEKNKMINIDGVSDYDSGGGRVVYKFSAGYTAAYSPVKDQTVVEHGLMASFGVYIDNLTFENYKLSTFRSEIRFQYFPQLQDYILSIFPYVMSW